MCAFLVLAGESAGSFKVRCIIAASMRVYTRLILKIINDQKISQARIQPVWQG